MKTEVVKIESPSSEKDFDSIARAAEIIRRGGLVVFPTETVYGLGGDGTDANAAQKIYAAKGRPSDNPLIIHISSPNEAEKFAYTNEYYYKLASVFMPGPLTVILKKKDTVPYSVTGGLDTVAIRCPSNEIARALIERSGVPIAAPSANISGKPSPTCASHVIDDLYGKVDMIIDGGEAQIGLESTIVKLDGDVLTLLRPGGITVDALRCVMDKVEVSHAVAEKLAENERPLSPGMKYRHYAPSAPLVLLEGDKDKVVSFLMNEQRSKKCIILCYSEEMQTLNSDGLIDIGSESDLDIQAHRLFSALREADKITDTDVIYAHLPSRDGMGLALYNRMIRAAAHTIKHID